MSRLRSAFRLLRRSPAFAATAILTLGIAIGANTAVFSLADAILLKPLPYPQPDRLAAVVSKVHGTRGDDTETSNDGAAWEMLRDHATTLDVAMMAGGFGRGVNLVVGQQAAVVSQTRVGAGYFRVLGVSPFIGREFTPEQDRPNGPAVAMLTYRLWQRLFQGDTGALGKTILLRGEPYEVVGVMPESFKDTGDSVDVWTPARPSTTGEGGGSNYGVIARVRDGHTWDEANQELRAISEPFFVQRGLPQGASKWSALMPLHDFLRDDAREPIQMLIASVAMVLLIACVNLAALLLARGSTRAREMATRMALGSGRAAIVRQLLGESLVIGAAGGLLGVAVAYFGLQGLQALAGDTFEEWRMAALDGRALALTAGLSMVTSVLFGLAPALQASRFAIATDLTGSGSRSIAGSSRQVMRRTLIVAEVALGVVLLVVTGLLIRTFVNLRTLDPGFDPNHLTTAPVSLQDARYSSPAQINRLFDDSLTALRRTPGVEAAAVSLELPYSRLLNSGFRFGDEPVDDQHQYISNFMYVTPQFFETLRIPLRKGRVFSDADRDGAPLVAVVNETFMRAWSKDHETVGRPIGRGATAREIVGVVGDVQVTNSGIGFPGRKPGPLMTTPTVFIPAAQTSEGFFKLVHTWFSPVWSVRAAAAVNAGAAISQAIASVDPRLPVATIRSMSAVQAASMRLQRLLMMLLGILASAAILLAAIGIHGVIAQNVAERTREFGIRLALGATAARTVRAVTGTGLVLALAGAIVGGGLSLLAVRSLQSMNGTLFWNVGARDPITYIGVMAFLFLVAATASLLPALRILRVDPAKTLRD